MKSFAFILSLAITLTVFLSVAAQAEVNISVEKQVKNLCKNVMQGADYVGGVDVNGNAVAPADLPSDSAANIPDVMNVPVTIDLASYLSDHLKGLELKSHMGDITVHKNGKVEWNGKDISSNMNDFCRAEQGNKSNAPNDLMPPPLPIDGGMDTPVPADLKVHTGPIPATVSPSITVTE